MKKSYTSLVSSLLFITIFIGTTSTAQAVSVEIFYETLNDAVRRFFVEQFKLATDNLNDDIELKLLPYGNTTQDPTSKEYSCPFGENQCLANKFHACFVVSTTNTTLQINFTNCFFKNRYAIDDIELLVNKCLPSEIDPEIILKCATNSTTDPNEQFAQLTSQISDISKDGFAVRIGGSEQENVNENAKTNLAGELCTILEKTDGICNQTLPISKVKIGVYYESMNLVASNYFISQLRPFYHVLEDFVDIELVPYGNTQYDESSKTYICSKGDRQCIINKFQALVVDLFMNNPNNGDPVSGTNRAINFVTCFAKSTIGNVFDALEICSNQNFKPDTYNAILEAIKENSPEVERVFSAMRTKTKPFIVNNEPIRIPLVTLNNQIDYNAYNDLIQESCKQYKSSIKASICTKVKVTVLYEPLNHKSRTFFIEQLKPIFNNLNSLMELEMIPAGRMELVPGHGFVCPNGKDQCDAIKLHACAIDDFWNDGNNYTDPIRHEIFDFIICTFKNKRLLNVFDAGEICSSENIEADAWFNIHGCYFDGTVNGILGDYYERTDFFNATDKIYPAVFIGKPEGHHQLNDLSTLKSTICDQYDTYHRPDYCETTPAPKVSVKVYYESMAEFAKTFFTTQYYPWYIYLEKIAQFELYPAGNVRENKSDGSCDSYDINSACMANKMQAFVIDKYVKHDDDGDSIDGTLRTMHFLQCIFNHPNWKDNIYNAAEFCSEETLLADEWYDILVTSKSNIGNKIYKNVLDITKKYMEDNSLNALEPIPWVTLDSQNHSKRAADDLLITVCNKYLGEKPLECTPVQVDVYYSAINPQSRRFFLDQLTPTYRRLRERMQLNLIPYGTSNTNLTTEDECKSQEKICTANKAQACAIVNFFNDDVIENSIQWDGKNQTLTFIDCMFKNIGNQDVLTLVEKCANNNIILGEEIVQCAKDAEGLSLLDQMRSKTMGQYQSMDHAPWIIINGIRSAEAESNLKQAICDQMLGDKPNFCLEPTAEKVKMEFHYSTLDDNSQQYVINELYPHYRLMEEIIDLDIIPFGLTEVLGPDEGNLTLICSNGIDECRTNLLHACVYAEFWHNDDGPISDNPNEYDGKLQVIEFLNCYFSSSQYPNEIVNAAEACVESIFGDYHSSINECAHSKLGIKILLEMQEEKVKPLLPHLTYVPWITINGKHSYSVEHHIQRTVCDTYTGIDKPMDCYKIDNTDPKPTIDIHYEPRDNRSSNFFTNGLIPERLIEISNLNMIPFGRSTFDDKTTKCVNDDEDCLLYKHHACLIDLYLQNYPLKTIQSISCTFGELINDPNSLNECVNQNLENDIPDVWGQIQKCVTDRGNELMETNAILVDNLKPNISHVPWIMVNGEHNLEAEQSLLNEICAEYYTLDKPTQCVPPLLSVGIYYETMNNDVNKFFLDQLSQYTEYLGEIGNFAFIPYGTTTNNDGTFTCPKGEKQCHASKVHACILNRFYNHSTINTDYEKNRIRIAGFLECTALEATNENNDPVLDAEKCLDRIFEGDFWRDIHYCSTGAEGADIYEEMERQTETLDPAMKSAPYITINSTYNQNAVTNLFHVLCDSYGLVRAPLCATLPSMGVKAGIYFKGDKVSQQFFREQVRPFYAELVPDDSTKMDATDVETKLSDIINPTLTAWGDTVYNESNDTNPFTCSGGVDECYINRMFACVDHYHGKEPRSTLHIIEFALCFFDDDQALTNPDSVSNKCANRVWVVDPFPELDTCAKDNTKMGIDIYLRMKNKTENNYPHLTSFPSVTINNRRDPNAEKNLIASACINYAGYKIPEICEQYIQTPTSTTTGSTTNGDGSSSDKPTTPAPTSTPTGSTTSGEGSSSDKPTTPSSTSKPTGSTTNGEGSSSNEPTSSPPPSTTPSSATIPIISIFVLCLSLIIGKFGL